MGKFHMIAFFAGFLLDLLLGDPPGLPHPVRLMGRLIAGLERRLLGPDSGHLEDRGKLLRGLWLVLIVTSCTVTSAAVLLLLAYRINPYAGMAVETVMTYQILAVKCLRVESGKVYDRLQAQDLDGARAAVSMIVGRDTAALDEEGVIKAAVETVAENTSDGVIAPMLYTALGGPALGFFYKAVNTMDSMVGYRNERYLYFGRTAARLDDLVNFLPARISACLMIFSAFAGGQTFSGQGAFAVWRRDRRNHKSPNSAQTEAVCAGALGIRLAGDAVYFGRTVKKPYIGDPKRKAEAADIRRANRLLYLTAWSGEILCLLFMLAVCRMRGLL